MPVDQTKYGCEDPVPTLWLPAREVRIRIVGESGKVLHQYMTTG
jgi:hypothetical protein